MKLVKKLQPIKYNGEPIQSDTSATATFRQRVSEMNNCLSQVSATMKEVMGSMKYEHQNFLNQKKQMSSSFILENQGLDDKNYQGSKKTEKIWPSDKLKENIDKQIISQISRSCQKVFDHGFQLFCKNELKINKVKQYCSENIMKIIINVFKSGKISIQNIQDIDRIFRDNLIPYLLSKYSPSNIDLIGNLMIQRKDEEIQKNFNIKYRQYDSYNQDIVDFVNKVLQVGHSKPPEQSLLQKISQEIKNIIKSDKILLQYKKGFLEENLRFENIHQINFGYFNPNKINFRNILKCWRQKLIESLTLKDSFVITMKDGHQETLDKNLNIILNWLIQRQKQRIDKKLKRIYSNMNINVSKYSLQKLSNQLEFINKDEAVIGQLCCHVDEEYQNKLIAQLNILLHGITKIIADFQQIHIVYLSDKGANLRTKLMELGTVYNLEQLHNIQIYIRDEIKNIQTKYIIIPKLQLVSSVLPKLVSYRLTLSKTIIQDIIESLRKYIINIHQNKFDGSSQILLLNLGFATVQLEIKLQGEDFVDICSKQFCNYLRELINSPFGTLPQLCQIWTNTDPRANYFYTKLKGSSRLSSFSKLQPTGQQLLLADKRRLKQISLKECQITDSTLEQLRKKSTIPSLKHVKSINLEQNQISLVKSISETFPNIQKAFLGANYISRVTSNDVTLWRENLEQLHINNNQLSDSTGIYTLENLLVLKINQTALKTLPVQIKNLRKLKYLDISSNGFTAQNLASMLIQDRLKKLTNLTTLIVNNNQQLQKIPGSISLMSKLNKLDISKNYLKQLPLEFNKLINLENVNLSENKFEIFPQIILKLTRLRNLNISYNSLQKIPTSITELKLLKQLYINNNQIVQLPQNFGFLKNLQILDICYNQLTRFEPQICKLENLTSLNLNYNKISDVSQKIANLRKLRYLNLSNNMITRFCDQIGQLTQLRELVLAHNGFQVFPQSFCNLLNLEILHFETNCIKFLPQKFCSLTSLTIIQGSQNLLQHLPSQFGKLYKLSSFNFSNNKIQSLPESVGDLHILRNMNIEKNQLKQIPARIGNLKNLVSLMISHNQLESLPEQIGNLQSLQVLYINDNLIKQLPRSIINLSQLRLLYGNSNKLVRLPEEIGFLSNLNSLYLEDNQISEVPGTMKYMRNLAIINLFKNIIKEFPQQIYYKLKIEQMYI